MQETFDPYHKWLGIPPDEQPASHYRLLGLSPFEADLDVISSAAGRVMSYVRTFQAGPHGAEAAQVLNETAWARVCLLDPQRKAEYDAVLKSAVPADTVSAIEQVEPPPTTQAMTGQFGAFELIECLRSTRVSQFYKAKHIKSGRLVSLKLLPTSALGNKEMQRRFKREQQLTVNLDHPNLIRGLAAGTYNQIPYLVTEYVLGTDLNTLVGQYGPLSVEQAVDYTRQAARGLMQMHMHGVYHRNIKPHVLLIDTRGRLKITNLFLAKLEEHATAADDHDELTRMGQMMGTAEYLPPEQAVDASAVDQRTDLYALGCTFHFMLTGRPPYGGKSVMQKIVAHHKNGIPSLRRSRSDVTARIDRVFKKMLAKEPAGRYLFMGDMLTELDQATQPSWLIRMFNSWFHPTPRVN